MWPAAGDAHLASVAIDATPAAGDATRRALDQHLPNRARPDELKLLKSLVYELVNNAVVQGGADQRGRVDLLIGLAPRRFGVEVRDDGAGRREARGVVACVPPENDARRRPARRAGGPHPDMARSSSPTPSRRVDRVC